MPELRDERLEIASFRTICEESPVGIFLCDQDGKSIYANPANLRQMGLTDEQARGDGWRRAIHPEDQAAVFERFSEAIRAGEIYEDECRYRRPDGTVVWVSVRISGLRDSARILGFVGTAEDITTRKQLEEEIRRAETMDTVGRLAGGIAHDFNNLLVAILGHAEIASGSLQNRRLVRESLAAIADAGRQAAELTRQLLTVAKHEVVKPEIIELSAQLHRLERLLRAAIRDDIDLRFELNEFVAPIYMDPSQFQRLVVNLVLNAQNAIEGKGRITVRARHVAARRAADDPLVELSVKDSGRGIDDKARARIFEPFYTTSRGAGMGLGLSTCYAIVQRAGGSIDVLSSRNRGSTFRVRLPAASERMEHGAPKDALKSRPAATGRSILLVDDEASVRAVLARGLRAQKFEVVEAGSVKGALRWAAEHEGPINLAICDVVLRDGSGLELQQQLRRHRPDLPFLFLSGYADDVMLQHGVERGEIAFLGKPFSIATLVEHVEKILSGEGTA